MNHRLVSISLALLTLVSVAAGIREAVAGAPTVAGEDALEPAAALEGPLSEALLARPNHRRFNVRIAGGADFGLGDALEDNSYGDVGAIGVIGIDWVLVEPLAFSVLAGYAAFSEGDAGALQDLFVTVGFRLRLFPDKQGALTEPGGNIAGHLFLDAHFGYHSYARDEHAGYNLGLGYEFSVSRDFNLGPFVRFAHTPIGDGFEYMSLSFGIQASVGGKFAPDDADNDGIEDPDDACPLMPEDMDGFEDGDGCPDPDNDQDGVPDVDDECPDTPGVPSNRGCEENDNDHDGILNKDDACPDQPEDVDGYADEDGCPDPDNDGDGIPDVADKCPNDAEDLDGFEDDDGCPDTDNDGDGVPDAKDSCPFIPGTASSTTEANGCPDFVRLTGNRILLLTPIAFEKDAISRDSHPILEELAALLNLKQELQVRIEGHTDDRGGRARNQRLSQARADAVKAYLVDKGVAEARMETAGLGQSVPIRDNKTKAGREENNRIEIHVSRSDINAAADQEAHQESAEPGSTP